MNENRLQTYEYLRRHCWNNHWAKRILSELGFLLEISKAEGGALDRKLLPAAEALKEAYLRDGALTKQAALVTEEALAPLAPLAKAYEITCAAHAHIDMNWMWGFHETVSLTVDTFRTVLQLMREYPAFTFSQSQASVYRIIETYAPDMLAEIRKYVHQGRWEVTASSWVENDKNMSGGEAMARHLLYTRKYLSRLLDIPEDSVKLDFEPDTFGHMANLPELLQKGGVKYYYHCRGMDFHNIYNWRAPSGAEVLVYREAAWYNQTIDYDLFLNVPGFCHTHGIKHYLKVYGVGDHGGGPTRRDLDMLTEMAAWPLFATVRFGTIQGFFEKLEPQKAQFPTVEGELNYVFTGCYTSQARIKRANRVGEDRLDASERLDVMAGLLCQGYRTASAFAPAWEKVLFNQFHDILPGSGVVETREYAMGQFQEAMAVADVNASQAMNAICANIDTQFLVREGESGLSTGAGVGYGTSDGEGYLFPAAERGSGSVRAYALFNPTQYARRSAVALTVWDWPDDAARMRAEDARGTPIPIQVLDEGQHYWGHHYTRIMALAEVPPMGYTTLVLRSAAQEHVTMPLWLEPRTDHITDEPIILENAFLRAVFDPDTMELLSLVHRPTGREFLDQDRPAGSFCLAEEETSNAMTAWRVGKLSRLQNLSEACPVRVSAVCRGPVRQSVTFSLPFASSELRAVVSLDSDSRVLRYDVTVDWNECGSASGVPQLHFTLPLADRSATGRCVIPFGVIDRPALRQDVPCRGLIAQDDSEETVALLSDCKYGFRHEGDRLMVDLIRASCDPDPKPEVGMHTFALGIAVTSGTPDALLTAETLFSQPICANSIGLHPGSLPLEESLLQVSGCKVSCIKRAESGGGLILRLYNPNCRPVQGRLTFRRPPVSAAFATVTERSMSQACPIEGNSILIPLERNSIQTVCVRF